MQVREAFDKGLGVAKTRQGEAGILEDSPQAWQAWSKTASPDEMDAARAGALADLQRRVAQASKPVSEQTAGAPIPQINQNERARFDTLFGPDKTNMFIQKLRDEKDRGSLNQVLFGGSETAARQAGQESVAAPPARGTSAGTNPNVTAHYTARLRKVSDTWSVPRPDHSCFLLPLQRASFRRSITGR